MKYFVKLAFILIFLILPLGIIAQAKSYEEIDKEVNALRSNLVLSIEPVKNIFKFGKPVLVKVVWQNNSGKDFITDNPYVFKIDKIEIYDYERELFYIWQRPRNSGAWMRQVEIKPNAFYSLQEDISQSFLFKPGEYQITVRGFNSGKFSSSIKIKVVK